VSIEIYDDRVEIINPGGLHKGLSQKEFGNISLRRNEIIADLFYRLDKVERMGMGIKKMRSLMKNMNMNEPKFAVGTFFTITFERSPALSLKPVGEHAALKSAPENALKIMELMIANPNITKPALAEALGISSDAIKRLLKKMQLN
jgi:ATP-dependent DNA helicase RecG